MREWLAKKLFYVCQMLDHDYTLLLKHGARDALLNENVLDAEELIELLDSKYGN